MAGGSSYQDEDGLSAISDINVTPLVDVVLVLLVIFMVTATMIVGRGIELEEPKTASGTDVRSTLKVSIDKNRVLYVNGAPFDDMELARQAVAATRAEAERPAEVKAIIEADTNVPHGDVMRAIDVVKLAGVTKFALSSRPLLEEAPRE
jgi:biopolymer transport protein TolR